MKLTNSTIHPTRSDFFFIHHRREINILLIKLKNPVYAGFDIIGLSK
jgi:hypothetical protein